LFQLREKVNNDLSKALAVTFFSICYNTPMHTQTRDEALAEHLQG